MSMKSSSLIFYLCDRLPHPGGFLSAREIDALKIECEGFNRGGRGEHVRPSVSHRMLRKFFLAYVNDVSI